VLPSRAEDESYGTLIMDAVIAIDGLGLTHERIETLDTVNPFPVLFLAPAPKGIHVWWNFGYNLPKDAPLSWRAVIGDACVVTLPLKPLYPGVTRKLSDEVNSVLQSDFKIVYEDKRWKYIKALIIVNKAA
jgi:hypothetical protein